MHITPANAGRKAVFCQRREKHAWRARRRNRLSMTAYGPKDSCVPRPLAEVHPTMLPAKAGSGSPVRPMSANSAQRAWDKTADRYSRWSR